MLRQLNCFTHFKRRHKCPIWEALDFAKKEYWPFLTRYNLYEISQTTIHIDIRTFQMGGELELKSIWWLENSEVLFKTCSVTPCFQYCYVVGLNFKRRRSRNKRAS